MAKTADKPPPTEAQLADVGAELLANFTREQVRASIAALREGKVIALATDAAARPDRYAMQAYLRDPHVLHDKADEARALAAAKPQGRAKRFIALLQAMTYWLRMPMPAARTKRKASSAGWSVPAPKYPAG